MPETMTAPGVPGRGRAFLLAGVAFQAAVLLGLIAWRVVPLTHGDTVLLRVVPIDPRDLFRGDYVTLGYECSRVPRGSVEGLGGGLNFDGQTVYVPLVRDPDGRHWHGEGCTAKRPASGTFLRGRLSGSRIEFGIESYYVQEGKGKAYEEAVRKRRLWAEVAVAPDGQAALRKLVIE